MLKPQKYRSKIIYKEWLNSHDIFVSLKVMEPSKIEFIAGNFINIYVGNGAYRVFSIVSKPENTDIIDIVVSASHEGKASNFFRDAKIDDIVDFIGPSGRFVLPEVLSSKLIFGATGVGLAPFIPMLYELQNRKYAGSISLYLGVTTIDNIFFEDVLKKFSSELNFQYFITLSEPHEGWNGLTGHINPHLPVDNQAQYFLCGQQEMVSEVSQMLTNKGISPEKIFSEKFIFAKNQV